VAERPTKDATGRGVLLISCVDRPGIVAAVAGVIADEGGNIVDAQQHTDPEDNVFFQRVEFDLDGLAGECTGLRTAFGRVARRFEMDWTLRLAATRPRLAILVSREAHCLHDLLYRSSTDELHADVALVISNHPDHADLTAFFGVPYVHAPVTAETRAAQEREIEARLRDVAIEVVVLARYMQILSPQFVERYKHRVINIHHSFLPAFTGGRPYHQAHERGVKLIGATAHYATAELDQGPIIEQDVVRVSHRDTVDEMVRKGRDLEKLVLARAVRLHSERRVLPYGNRTVVFA
jgi:formyltetrahydrofolate deformylase